MELSLSRPRLAALGVPNSTAAAVLLVLIMAVGAGVRTWGLKWGLPSEEHYFSYHPDETTVVGHALSVDVFAGQLNPQGFFNYGTLQIYLVHLACQFASGWGYLDFTPSGRGFIDALSKAHLVARGLTVLMGMVTVWVVWLLGKRCGSDETGLWAAALFALCGGHVANSHYATVDVPVTLWTTLCLLACVSLARRPARHGYLFGGITLGFACATKYGAAVLLVPLIVAHSAAGRRPAATHAKQLGTAALAALAAFFVGCPYSLLSWPEFLHDVRFEAHHSRVGKGLLFEGTGSGWLYHLRMTLPLCLSWPVMVAALAAAPLAIRRARVSASVLLSFVGVCYLMLGSAQVCFVRYVVPLLPPLALFIGLALSAKGTAKGRWLRRALGILLVVLAGAHCYLSCRAFAGRDPRDRAAAWLRQHATAGDSVGLINRPWFYTPPVVPYNGGPQSARSFEDDPAARRYRLTVTGWDASALAGPEPPRYLVLSEYEFHDQLRLCELPRSASRAPLGAGPDESFVAFWNALHERYQLAATYGGWRAPKWLAPTGYVTHDWLYPMPETRVYQLRNGTVAR